MSCDHNYIVEGMADDFQRMVCDKCGAEKPPFIITNARVSYPQLRSPSYPIGEGAKSFRLSIKHAYDDSFGSFRWCFLASFVSSAGGDPTSTIVGYDPQKLLPSPRITDNLPAWYTEWLESPAGQGAIMHAVFAAYIDMPVLDPMFPGDEIKTKPATPYVGANYDEFDKFFPHLAAEDDRRMAEITQTRRFLPFDVTRWNESDADPLADLEKLYDEIKKPWPHKMAVIPVETTHLALDYGRTEARILAMMGREDVRAIVLDLDSTGGFLDGSRDLLAEMAKTFGIGYDDLTRDFPRNTYSASGYDYSSMLKRDKLRTKAARGKPAPSYLKHDPTKNRSRRRK